MHRKSRRLALVGLCVSTLTGGGIALLSGPAVAATSTVATGGGDCAKVAESSYTTSRVALRPAALPRVSTVSVPVITQPVIAQPVLAQPMTVSVNIQPAYTAPRHFRSERLVSQPIAYRYRSTLFASELAPTGFRAERAAYRTELSAMALRAEQRVEAAADRAEARIQHRANVAEARVKRAAKKAERRLIRKERKLERRLERRLARAAAWRYVDP